ncbi:MAG TPA: MotA/TolQ/ExbB proton channel family protein [Thermoanaerobaculia bacterium]|nr:MotA/TolQ/ExbB proton channel family protein [Thermoanaerobaculia bacterium]
MNYLQRASTASPRTLLLEPGFWRANRAYVGAIGGGVLLMAVLGPLTYQEVDSWMWLTAMIQLLVFWGAAVGARALADIEVDDAIARLVDRRASTELGEIKGGHKDRVVLDRVESDFLPHNPSHDKGVVRLFQHILHEARDRKFHATEVVVQPFQESALGDLLRIQTVQKIALQLGILGTFAGLIVAMQRLKDKHDLLAPDALKDLFGALHVSFSTSIAGLEVAIVLAVALLVVRRRQESFFQNMESASATLTSLARNSVIQDEFLVELEQTRTTLAQVGQRVREQTREVEVQTGTIRGGLERLASLRSDFDSFLERIRQEQGIVLGEMKSVYEIIAPRQVAEEFRQSLLEANRQLAESFQEDLRQSLAALHQVSTTLELVKDLGNQAKGVNESQMQSFEESRATFERAASEIAGTMARLPAELVTKLNESAHQAAPEAQFQGAARNLERIARSFESLSRNIGRNNSLLEEIVWPIRFYRSLWRRSWAWWESLRRT